MQCEVALGGLLVAIAALEVKAGEIDLTRGVVDRARWALEHGVEGCPGLGGRGAQALTNWVGDDDSLADEKRAGDCGKPRPTGLIRFPKSIGNSYRRNQQGKRKMGSESRR